ncbi:MAG: DUF3575 domain-containing protein [Bacteroidetes bacterium]|nr:DUF3575 domain-containing protein [Bacteroidota bacterium]
MKRIFILLSIFLVTGAVQAQSFLVKKNIISTSLFTPFEDPGGYSLSYERMLDKGQSLNAAQFSVKLNTKLINDKKPWAYTEFEGVKIYDNEAFQYSGFSFVPEVKYYFGWDSPFGPYFSLYGSYAQYTESFKDMSDNVNNYNTKFTRIGRGIGVGYQFRIGRLLAMDIGGGYIMEDVSSKQQKFGETDFTSLDKEKDDGLRVAVTFGVSF